MKVDWDVVWQGMYVFEVNVVEELYSTSNNEKDLCTLVTLAVKNIFRVDFDLRE